MREATTLFDVGVFEANAASHLEAPLEPRQRASDVDSTDDDSKLTVEEDTVSSQLVQGLNSSQIEQGFDVGTLTGSPTTKELEEIVRAGHIPHPNQFPRNVAGRRFPTSILTVKKQNSETSRCCWIVFSPNKQAIFRI